MNARTPDPPVNPEVDLRDFPYVPIFRSRLFGSEFHASVSDTAWRAGMTLWLRSWDQVPAGSLPSDERSLCRLAELGRDVRIWRKVAADALHGWFLASDGRLYHPVVAEVAIDAWQKKMARQNRTRAANKVNATRRVTRNVTPPKNERDAEREDNVTLGITERDASVTRPKTSRHVSVPQEGKGREGEAFGFAKGPNPSSNGLSLNGRTHAREDEDRDGFFDEDDFVPFGRSAPLAASPPLRGKELKEHRKALLLQKLMRFANDTMSERERQTAINGLMGLDAQHSMQWWLDTLDQTMRAARWDDTQ